MGNSEGTEKNGIIAEENKLLVGFENVCYLPQERNHQPYAMPIQSSKFSSIIRLSVIFSKNMGKRCVYKRKNGGIIGNLNELYGQYKKKQTLQSVSTERTMALIEKKSGIFEREYHQDSHQFFIWILNQVHDQLKKVKAQSELEDVFMSKRITRIQCHGCKNVTESQVEDIDLSLFLPEPNVSLNNCIQQYSKIQKLEGSNKFKCDKCNSLQDASKVSLIKTLPKFLSIHMRRFKYDEIKKGMIKLNWLIPFPFKLKVKSNYSQQKEETAMYKLVGVISHIGQGENYGHYISYIKIDNVWYEFNDDQINKIDDYMLESLWGYKGLTKCAYMLFYSL